ncbi:efflux RND transporter periplasmic adaptor subunit [Acanthopleuribacter pedis]|uniref:Efflux RND transporter periplasmic adaptor subunit n=1 Tax=Acanthopleuribacter pedis TaxID=442870 RepID=A0A8J7QE15_9BACT|nr:efflux RND transporter periplasmic adaptor subunit [Acanthopleuribacter pedis]MBO1322449.1 efflux RND transporter periplasmic adaptor subunit [Acanthopleuribacter pedis]
MDKLFLSMSLALFLVGCSHVPHGHHAGADHQGHDDQGHAHDDHGHGHDTVVRQVTLYNEQHEFFVEHPPLVAGQAAEFTIHLTRLADWQPEQAPVVGIRLSRGEGAAVAVQAARGGQAGIYTAEATPASAGAWSVTYSLAGDPPSRVTQNKVTVYADQHAADHADEGAENQPALNLFSPLNQMLQAPAEEGEEIVYLKQQQWLAPFRSEPLNQRVFREAVEAPAQIEARSGGEAMIHAPLGGRLLAGNTTWPEFGRRVQQGRPLALLQPRFQEAEDPAALELALQQARLDHDFAVKDLARIKRLHREGVAAVETLQRAELTEADHRAEKQAAQQRQTQFARLQAGNDAGIARGIALTAPISGTIVAAHAVQGALVTEDEVLWHLVDLERVWLTVQVSESEIHRVPEQAVAWFVPPGGDQAVAGRLVVVGGSVDPRRRTVPVIFEVPNAEGLLKIGMHVKAWIGTGNTTRGWAVPHAALMEEAGQTVVYAQINGETFSRRVVQVGQRDGTHAHIRSGLAGVKRIVTQGTYQLHLAGNTTAVPDHGHVH